MQAASDVIVVGGGPAGATAALRAARNGLRVTLLEQDRHPRFHIGESFLPRNVDLLRELGLHQAVSGLPRVSKLGASFCLGNEAELTDYRFDSGLIGGEAAAFNIERAPFDALLLERAEQAGARVREGVKVKSIRSLSDGAARLEVVAETGATEEIAGRYLIDASGQATVVGRHLGTRRTLPDLKRVAYFEHYTGVHRREGVRGGFPLVVMCREGWFWLIPIDERRCSIGLVMRADLARRVGVASDRMLDWGIERCPVVRELTAEARGPASNRVVANFSYTCRPYAGPGYFMVGDAATFVDPIFSTGVCLGMMSAIQAADAVRDIVQSSRDPDRLRRRYRRFVEGSSSVFFRLVRSYYEHPFRELFLHGRGPLNVHRAVMSVLAGHVFPMPPYSLRWRVRLFEVFVRLQRMLPLAPRRESFSLIDAELRSGLPALDQDVGVRSPSGQRS